MLPHMNEGDVIRVVGWPGTARHRYRVVRIDAMKQHAHVIDVDSGRTRVVPVENCEVVEGGENR